MKTLKIMGLILMLSNAVNTMSQPNEINLGKLSPEDIAKITILKKSDTTCLFTEIKKIKQNDTSIETEINVCLACHNKQVQNQIVTIIKEEYTVDKNGCFITDLKNTSLPTLLNIIGTDVPCYCDYRVIYDIYSNYSLVVQERINTLQERIEFLEYDNLRFLDFNNKVLENISQKKLEKLGLFHDNLKIPEN